MGTRTIDKDEVLQVWLDNPRLSFTEIAEKAGIDRTTFYWYRQDPEFMAKYHERCKQRFAQLEALALENLMDKLNDEDWQATKYALDGLKYNATQQVEVSTPTPITININE